MRTDEQYEAEVRKGTDHMRDRHGFEVAGWEFGALVSEHNKEHGGKNAFSGQSVPAIADHPWHGLIKDPE